MLLVIVDVLLRGWVLENEVDIVASERRLDSTLDHSEVSSPFVRNIRDDPGSLHIAQIDFVDAETTLKEEFKDLLSGQE